MSFGNTRADPAPSYDPDREAGSPKKRGNPPITRRGLISILAWITQAQTRRLDPRAPEPDHRLLCVDAARGNIKRAEVAIRGGRTVIDFDLLKPRELGISTFFTSPPGFAVMRLVLSPGVSIVQNSADATDTPLDEQKFFLRIGLLNNFDLLRLIGDAPSNRIMRECQHDRHDLQRGSLSFQDRVFSGRKTRDDLIAAMRERIMKYHGVGSFRLPGDDGTALGEMIERAVRAALTILDEVPLGGYLPPGETKAAAE